MRTFSKCSEVLIISYFFVKLANVLKVLRMICFGSKAMLAVSTHLFTNISRNVQQTDMLSVLDWGHFYMSWWSQWDNCNLGYGADAAVPELGVTTAVQDFLTGSLRQQCPWMKLDLRLFKALHWVDIKNSSLTCLLVSCILLSQFISYRYSLWTGNAVDIEGSPLSPTVNLPALWNHIFIISIYF